MKCCIAYIWEMIKLYKFRNVLTNALFEVYFHAGTHFKILIFYKNAGLYLGK